MRVLITGGAGFIGSNLADYLLDNNCEVIIIDDLSTGKKENIAHLKNKIKFVEADISTYKLFTLGDLDGVVHLAAQPSVPLSIENFKTSSSLNSLGSINVIDFCKGREIPFVYASSSAIYGNLPIGDDESNDIDLLSPYSADKYSMEIYAKVAFSAYNLSSIGLRFFNVYGPRQDPSSPYSGVISIFADKLLKKQSITINGGYQTRDFIYVNDVVHCIHLALNLAKEKKVCESVNVLTGTSVTINELSDTMCKDIGFDAEKTYRELPLGDPEVSKGTTNKLSNLLNIAPSKFTDIHSGLNKTIEFIRKSDIDE